MCYCESKTCIFILNHCSYFSEMATKRKKNNFRDLRWSSKEVQTKRKLLSVDGCHLDLHRIIGPFVLALIFSPCITVLTLHPAMYPRIS